MKTSQTVLSVEGMTCPSCVPDVEAALLRLAGVAAVEVSWQDGSVRVEHADQSFVSMLVALRDAGYPIPMTRRPS